LLRLAKLGAHCLPTIRQRQLAIPKRNDSGARSRGTTVRTRSSPLPCTSGTWSSLQAGSVCMA